MNMVDCSARSAFKGCSYPFPSRFWAYQAMQSNSLFHSLTIADTWFGGVVGLFGWLVLMLYMAVIVPLDEGKLYIIMHLLVFE